MSKWRGKIIVIATDCHDDCQISRHQRHFKTWLNLVWRSKIWPSNPSITPSFIINELELVHFQGTLAKTEIIYPKKWAPNEQWISHKMNYRHPWQLKKSKFWELFRSYQLNSTANLANLVQFWGKWAGLAVLFGW